MERRRVTLTILFLVTLMVVWFFPTSLFADQGDDDLLPSGSIDSPAYSEFSKDLYIIDYAPPEDPSLTDTPMINIIKFLTLLLNMGWKVYLFLVELTIRIVNWVYDPKLIDKLFGLMGSLMPSLVNNIWKPLWFLVAGIGILAVILIWMMGNTNRSLTSIATILLLVAFVPSTLLFLPTILSKANTLVTTVGSDVMSKMVQTEAKKIEAEMKKKEQQELTKSVGVTFGLKAKKNLPFTQQERQILAGIHAMDDSIWMSLVIQPYWIANFGSVESGKKYWRELLAKGNDLDARATWLRGKGGMKKDTGVPSNPDFIIFTTNGFGERFYKLFVATVLPLVPLVVVIGTAVIVLIWKARAIGRTIFLIFDYLMALYPGYGISTAIQATVKALAAFAMALFYTIGLSVFLAFWMKLQNPVTFSGVSFGDRILLIVVILFGMWAGINGVQQRLGRLPGIFGGATQLGDGQNDLGLLRRMVAWQAIGAVQKPIGKAVGTLSKYGLKKPVKWTGKQAWKGTIKGTKKIGTGVGNYIADIDAVKGAGHKLKSFFRPGQAQLTANLSEDASNVYENMVKKNLNPESLADQSRFLQLHPDQSEHMDELNNWLNQSKQAQIYENIDESDDALIPAAPPPKTSPLYHVWKYSPRLQEEWKRYSEARKKVHGERYREYAARKQKYEQNLVHRLFTRRPKFVEPSQREYLMEYRKLMDEKKAK